MPQFSEIERERETYLVTLKMRSSRRARNTLIPKDVPGLMVAHTTSKILPTITCTSTQMQHILKWNTDKCSSLLIHYKKTAKGRLVSAVLVKPCVLDIARIHRYFKWQIKIWHYFCLLLFMHIHTQLAVLTIYLSPNISTSVNGTYKFSLVLKKF